MDTFLTVLSWATPPIVGALIGYATNRIAIKMLFRPLEPKYLVRWRIPLTPGIIPRNREDLAASIGTAVGGELLSEEAIRDYVDDPELRSAVEGMIPRPLGFSKPVLIRVLRALLRELRKRIDVPKLVEGRVNEYDIHDMGAHDSGRNRAASEVDKLVRCPSWRTGWLPPACVECVDLATAKRCGSILRRLAGRQVSPRVEGLNAVSERRGAEGGMILSMSPGGFLTASTACYTCRHDRTRLAVQKTATAPGQNGRHLHRLSQAIASGGTGL